MTRHPDEIMADLDFRVRDRDVPWVRAILWEIMADIESSYELAMDHTGIPVGSRRLIRATVNDYLVNNYGDD